MEFYQIAVAALASIVVVVLASQSPSCPPLSLPHGRVYYRNEQKTAEFSCSPAFRMLGSPTIRCWEGSWSRLPPICFNTVPGCPVIRDMVNGRVFQTQEGGVLGFKCSNGFVMRGSSVIFCNGTKWNDSIPICQSKSARATTVLSTTVNEPANSGIVSFCSFEQSCGWIQEAAATYKWTAHDGKAPNGGAGMGPSQDASSRENGFYMYARPSAAGDPNDSARLLSPVYPDTQVSGSSCFTFWYYLHGMRTRTLTLFTVEYASGSHFQQVFRVQGDQGDRWIKAQVLIPTQSEAFRIVFEVKRGQPHAADVAIDDVTMLSYACVTNSSVMDQFTNFTETATNSSSQNLLDDEDFMQEFLNGSTTEHGEINIDIYELAANKSFVDEPSEFVIQVIHPHSATINPRNYDGFDANADLLPAATSESVLDFLNNLVNVSTNYTLPANVFEPTIVESFFSPNDTSDDGNSTLIPLREDVSIKAPQGTDNGEYFPRVSLYTGIAIGVAMFAVVIILGIAILLRRRRAKRQDKPATEETEFQYFSYANEGFHEIATLPADAIIKPDKATT